MSTWFRYSVHIFIYCRQHKKKKLKKVKKVMVFLAIFGTKQPSHIYIHYLQSTSLPFLAHHLAQHYKHIWNIADFLPSHEYQIYAFPLFSRRFHIDTKST